MNNKCPVIVRKYLCSNKLELQLVPPKMHWKNEAENSIGKFKDNFIAGLATVSPQFPLHLWCQIIPLKNINIDLLCAYWIDPRI